MYFWLITFALLQIQYYVCAHAHREDGENIEKLVYLLNGPNSHDRRSGNIGGSNTRDIEASRRSVIDKNFMRFGRSKVPQTDDNAYDENDDENIMKRTAHENFMRFGRLPSSSTTNFMRFGRNNNNAGGLDDSSKLLLRPSRYGNKDENFIRFGKRHHDAMDVQDYDDDELDDMSTSKTGLRLKRNTVQATDDKRATNDNFMRFGRNSNFIRFGRQDFLKCSLYNFHACLPQPQLQVKYPQLPIWLTTNQLQQPIIHNFDDKNMKQIDRNLSNNFGASN